MGKRVENGIHFTLQWDYVISSTNIITRTEAKKKKLIWRQKHPRIPVYTLTRKRMEKKTANTNIERIQKMSIRDRAGQIICVHRKIESSKWNKKKLYVFRCSPAFFLFWQIFSSRLSLYPFNFLIWLLFLAADFEPKVK